MTRCHSCNLSYAAFPMRLRPAVTIARDRLPMCDAPLATGRLGEWGKLCYTVPADVEICDGLRNLRSAACHGFNPPAPA